MRFALLLMFGLTACQPTAVPLPVLRPATVPRMRATTLVVKTNLLPEKKAFVHLVMIGNGKARIGNEVDQWRLFDLENNSVTFVDDIAKSYRTESFQTLVRQKRESLGRSMPEFVPTAEFVSTDHQRTFDGVPATLHQIRFGGYRRSLWMSRTLELPQQLFPLIVASDPINSPYAPAMAPVFEGMLVLRGFPLLDRADIGYGGEGHLVEKRLVRVEQRRIPAVWLQLPGGYQDLTPRPPQASRHPMLPQQLRETFDSLQ